MAETPERWVRIGNTQIKMQRSLRAFDIGLSSREVETLGYLARGLSLSEVAAKMAVKPNTIATYKTRVFNKLGVNTTAQALVIATAIVCGGQVRVDGQHHLNAA